IQMPNESGFALFEKVETNFEVIFVTAFDNYAIRAFEVNALDYLLKPVSPNRLAQSVARLQEQGSSQTKSKLSYDDYIFIKTQGRAGFIKLNTIVYILATGDYTEIHTTSGEKKLVLKSMREWEESLPERHFLRIHRAIIINIEFTEKVEPWFRSTYQVY